MVSFRLALVLLAVLLGMPAGARAQDDWGLTRPHGGGHSPAPHPRGEHPRVAPHATAPESRDAETARRDALMQRYLHVLDVAPGDGFALERLTALYRERDGNIDGLRRELVARVDADAQAYAPRLLLGRLDAKESRLGDAETELRAACALRASDPACAQALGDVLLAESRPVDARVEYEVALGLSRDDATKQALVRSLAAIAMDAGDFDGARAYYDRLGGGHGASVFLATDFARALSSLHEYARAAAEYERVRQRLAGDTRVMGPLWRDLGRAYRDAGDLPHAEAALDQALRVGDSGVRAEAYELLADVYRRGDRLAELVARLARDPSPLALSSLGRVDDELGHADDAVAAYRRALSRDPRDLDTRLRLVQLLVREGKLDDAIAEYRALVRASPGEPRFVVELAQLLEQTGAHDEARRVTSAASRSAPRDARVHEALAELYSRWHETELATAETAILARIDPSDPAHLVALGTEQLEGGHGDAALLTWQRIVQGNANDASAHLTLAGVYADHDFLVQAVTEFRTAVQLAPEEVEAQRGLASALERSNQNADAVTAWERVLGLSRGDSSDDRAARREARQRIVAIYARQSQGELARRIAGWDRAFRAEPSDVGAGRYLVEAYARTVPARVADAERVLDRLVEVAPGDVESLLALERLRTARGDLAGAILVLGRLVRADDRRAAAYLGRMAEDSLALYRDDDAIRYAEQAVARSPDDPSAQKRLGDLYRARQDFPHAMVAYRRAIALDSRLYATYFDLAEIELAQGDQRGADGLFREVVRTSPDDDLVARAAHAALQIHVGQGTLEELEQELLAEAIANPGRPLVRRLLVEVYEALVPPIVLEARAPGAAGVAARERLARIGTRAIKPLLEALADDDPSQRVTGVVLLGALGNDHAQGPLLAMAEGEGDALLRARALVAAGALNALPRASREGGPPRPVEPRFLALAQGPEARLRDAAAWAAARHATRADAPALRDLALRGDPGVRAMCALGLGVALREGPVDPTSRAMLEQLLARDPNDDVRAAAAWALAQLARPESVPVLVAALETRGGVVSRAAALALGTIHDVRAEDALARALFDPQADQRGAAVAALRGAAGPPRAPLPPPDLPLSLHAYVRALLTSDVGIDATMPVALASRLDALGEGAREALAGPVERVRAALLVLGAGAGPGLALGGLTSGIDAWPPESRDPARATLVQLATLLAPQLVALTTHPDAQVRALAVALLPRLDTADARAALLAAVDDGSPDVVRAALAAIATVPPSSIDDATAERVTHLLEAHADWVTRARAATTLGHLGGTAASASLVRALSRDSYAFVREASARALAPQANEPAVRAALVAARDGDAEPRVRSAAGDALAPSH